MAIILKIGGNGELQQYETLKDYIDIKEKLKIMEDDIGYSKEEIQRVSDIEYMKYIQRKAKK